MSQENIFEKQYHKVANANGFIAALDQSGGSTPKALKAYGLDDTDYTSDGQMFDLIHAMRARIVQSPAFSGDKVLAAILFEMTLDRDIGGKPSSVYLWEDANVVPFLKIDKGLEAGANNVQLLKPIPDLDALLQHAKGMMVFGTKMRSVISGASDMGIKDVVAQQFDIAKQVLKCGLIPIIEPEIDISIKDKGEAEMILRGELIRHLAQIGDHKVILKLTLPSINNHYQNLIGHPNILRVVALSGGYSQQEANLRLSKQLGMIASFSRALTQGLAAHMDEDDFNNALKTSINRIYQASLDG